MTLDQQSEMAEAKVDAFLARHETGVLALARADDPYAIPVSYGYDPVEECFFLRLVAEEDSEKRRFLTDTPAARLVVYEEGETAYRSVVANGTLETVSTDDIDVERIQQFGDAKRPLFEFWSESKADLDITLYELAPDDLTGRRADLESADTES